MNESHSSNPENPVNRRSFLRKAGGAAAAMAGLSVMPPPASAQSTTSYTPSPDTPEEIFTTMLIAEDLATVFYYQGLSGPVIQDPNLAGPGGSYNHITTGSAISVDNLRGAFTEDITHAKLFRSMLYGSAALGDADPVQTFYFPTGTFDTLEPFVRTLEELKQILISAYMCVVREFTALAVAGHSYVVNGVTYQVRDFIYFAYLASSMLGVEAEHRALGRVIDPTLIPDLIPANNYNYEAQNDIVWVTNRGARAAAAKVAPFTKPGSGLVAYTLQDALRYQDGYRIQTILTIPGLI